LGPADLPNPHAPVSTETIIDEPLNGWSFPHKATLDAEKNPPSVVTQIEEWPDATAANPEKDIDTISALSDTAEQQAQTTTAARQAWLALKRRSADSPDQED